MRMQPKRVVKYFIIVALIIIVFALNVNIAVPITIDQTPEYEIREGSLGFVYPLLDGFYSVDDWEVAVCLHEKYKEQLEQKETRNAINDMMVSDYGGLVVTVTAKVELNVTDPKETDLTKTANRYTVCYGIMPTGEDDIDFNLYLISGSNLEMIIPSGTAPATIGAGGCEVKYFEKLFEKVYLKISGNVLQYPIIVEES